MFWIDALLPINMLTMRIQIFRFISLLFIFLYIPFSVFAEECPVRLEKELSSVGSVIKPSKELVFIEADRIHGYYKQEIEGVGKAELRRGDQTITADRMKYYQNTDDTEVEGSVRIERPQEIMEGTNLQLNLETRVGYMSEPNFYKKDGFGRGTGSLLLFEGEDNYRLEKGVYTTCPKGNDDWFIRADDLEIDNKKEVGTARNVSILFKDVPILYLPWIDFSYSGKRKTGMLAPIVGNTGKSGGDLAIPFYFNIAPNIDATVAPRIMTKRGIMVNNELRYITPLLQGKLLADILPDDLADNRTRFGVSFAHSQYFGKGWSGSFHYNRVSDDRFFRDLANNLAQTSQTNLLQQGLVSYGTELGAGGFLSFSALVQRFQTLQDPLAPFQSPYKRLPQLSLAAIKRNIAGMDIDFNGSWTNFSHPTLVDGKRLVLFPSISVPLRNAFGYLTPKVGLHYTRYNLSSENASRGENVDRTIPIFSLDSGVVFDRKMALSGRQFIQTLEPRAFYVYVPFRDQSLLPNFDSAESDFSFAQMLTENRFSGSDRVNDANQLTLALTSRLLEPESGIELLRVAIGQQFRFVNRRVTFDTQQVTSSKTDFIAAISGRITSNIRTDTNIQFDQSELRTEKIRTGLSYQPELGKVVNLGYRFSRDILEQVDASTQWSFAGKWYGVARVNYSLKDDRMLAGLAGFEYKSCCWAMRVVLQKLTTATQKTSTALFVQLELNGLMEIGTDPLRMLQESIPGYTSVY